MFSTTGRTAFRFGPVTVIASLFLASLAPDTHAFGPTGHRIVGLIAQSHLSPTARDQVRAILKAESLARASTWADEIRSDPKWDHAKPWHYVTIEDGKTYETSDRNPNGDVIEAIHRFVKVLKRKDATPEEKTFALRWLVHLVADIHQPLHVGRGDDRGGNSITVEWFGEKSNLHRVWDSDLIESTKLSYSEYADFINRFTPKQIRTWQGSKVEDWASESMKYRKRVYERPEAGVGGSYRYAYRNLPLVELRLGQAGVRLAGLLNSIFTPNPPVASGDSPDTKTILPEWTNLNNTMWVQRSEEYAAATTAAFRNAAQMLDKGLLDTRWTAVPTQSPKNEAEMKSLAHLPPAVIVDVDETALDNSPYAAWNVRTNQPFHIETWNRWVADGEAKAIPGAVEFVRHAKQKGVAVFYVTNRDFKGDFDRDRNGTIEPNEKQQPLQAFTIQNLRKVGLLPQEGISDDASLLMRGERDEWVSEKVQRREWVAKRYRVLLVIGDNITDFTAYDNRADLYKHFEDPLERRRELQKHTHRWGTTWIPVPNPTYGRWLPREIPARLEKLNSWRGPEK